MVSKDEFKKEFWQIAEEINAKPQRVRIRHMRSKIGSCSPKKIITFDVSVLTLDKDYRKEAIIHELLHLRYRNHGKMFKEVLKSYIKKIE